MFEPENELGVIVLFARQCEEVGFEILSIQTAFPDALVRRGDIEYRVEFEYQSSNFYQHGHDPREADLIICWKSDKDSVLPILALSEPGWAEKEIELPTQLEREVEYWKRRAKRAEIKLITLKNKKDVIIKKAKRPDGPVACGWCGRSFATQNALNAHARWCEKREEQIEIS